MNSRRIFLERLFLTGMGTAIPKKLATWDGAAAGTKCVGCLSEENATDATDSMRAIEKEGSGGPFTESGALIQVAVKGSKVPQWQEVQGSAGEIPPSPAQTSPARTELIMIPYGAAKLRITAFPQIRRSLT